MRKGFAFIIAVVLMLSASSAVIGAGNETLGWVRLDIGLEQGIEDFVCNGSVYIGKKGNDAYVSKDTKDWEKVFSVQDTKESAGGIKELFLIGDGTEAMLRDSSGDYYRSKDGRKWEESGPEKEAASLVSAEYRDGKLYIIKSGAIKIYTVEGVEKVRGARVINDKVLLFSDDGKNSSLSLVHYAPLKSSEQNRIFVNGKEVLPDEKPQLVENRLLVPFRFIAEALEAEVEWEPTTETVTAKKEGTEILFQINNPMAKINGVETEMEVPAKLIGSRTMVPLRFVAESFQAEVVWDYLESRALISTEKPEQQEDGKKDDGKTPPVPGTTTPVPSPGGGGNSGGDNSRELLRQEIVAKYSSRANALRDEGMGKIDSIVSEAKAKYDSLPAEQKTADKKLSLYLEALPKAEQAESEIKAKFEDILSQMKSELEAANLSTSAVDEAREQYNQMRIQKINELLNNL